MASLPVTCEKCKMDITSGRVVDALGKKWHPGCFLCSKCNGVIGADAHFVVLNNVIYIFSMFSLKLRLYYVQNAVKKLLSVMPTPSVRYARK